MADNKRAFEIFYSYAHEDREFQEKLEKQLLIFKRQGLISSWNDQDIHAGQEWEHEINAHLNTADIILLLVSPDFIASDYCYSKEMRRALERHNTREACVVPIIVRPVYWQASPIGKLQALPTEAKPVTQWPDSDEAFYDIATGIFRIIVNLTSSIDLPQEVGGKIEIAETNLHITQNKKSYLPEYISHEYKKLKRGYEYTVYFTAIEKHVAKFVRQRGFHDIFIIFVDDKEILKKRIGNLAKWSWIFYTGVQIKYPFDIDNIVFRFDYSEYSEYYIAINANDKIVFKCEGTID